MAAKKEPPKPTLSTKNMDVYSPPSDYPALGRKGFGTAAFVNYINQHITKSEEKKVERLRENPLIILDELHAIIHDGCKVSIKFDDKDGVFKATAMQSDRNHVNAGLCLGAWGLDIVSALAALLTKIDHFADSGEWDGGDKYDRYG